jgi:hypothetical protein
MIGCGAETEYDADTVMKTLAQLSDEERHALIGWLLFLGEARDQERKSA